MRFDLRLPLALGLAGILGCSPAPSAVPAQMGTDAGSASPAVAATQPGSTPEVSPATQDLRLAADLDGMLTSPALAHLLPLAVSIDDSAAARPQSGFNAASVVWQAPADGYESRYLFVFQEATASAIGPVRSARLYLAHWAAEDNAAFAHYGGDRMTRAWLTANDGPRFTDVDGIGAGNPAFHRIATRVAPHNAYTSTQPLQRMAVRLGAEPGIDPGVHLRPFRDDSPAAELGTIGTIRIPYNTVLIRYAFDPAADAYQRFVGSAAQVDPMNGQAVTARTIVVLYMPFHTDSTIEPGHNRPVLGFIGSGRAVVFMEGHSVQATWSKPSEFAPTIILGPDGTELPFVRGRIFMQVVPIGTSVTSGPRA
jgi:hypothetical protein